jgi:leucyl aminopeptidase
MNPLIHYKKVFLDQIKEFYPDIKLVCTERKFVGKLFTTLVLPLVHQGKMSTLVLMGLGAGNEKPITTETYRRAVAKLVRMCQDLKMGSIVFALPDQKLFQLSSEYLAEQTASMIHIAAYHFDEFITDPDRKVTVETRVTILAPHDEAAVKEGVLAGELIARSVNRARHWIDLPPVSLTPIAFLPGVAEQLVADLREQYKREYRAAFEQGYRDGYQGSRY